MNISYRSRLLSAILSFSTIVACSGSIEPENGGNGADVNGNNNQNVELNVNYNKQVLVMDFTSTGCPNCASLVTGLEELSKKNPGKFVTVAMHTHYGSVADPMAIAMTDTYVKKFSIAGLPSALVNFRADAVKSTAIDAEGVINEEFAIKPDCGLALETSFNSSNGEVVATVKVTSNKSKIYRYLIFVVESGIKGSQANVDGEFTHNHVARAVLANNVNGDRLNAGKPLVPGVECTATRKVSLGQGFNVKNMSIVAAVMSSKDNGVNWLCENVCECPLGENADYQIVK